jgi:(p)ppGpp synthase/HD superfamily hydrolase
MKENSFRPLSPRFTEALSYATILHANQRRKGTTIPYVSHLLAVAAIVLEYGGVEDEAIAALLHDAIEDQGGVATRDVILSRFGEEVAAIVDGCTDADTLPKPPWRQRKDAYIAHIGCASPSIRLVSAADKLANARSLVKDYRQVGDNLWDKFNASREDTLWYYRALVTAFQTTGSTPLIDELDRTVSELERLTASFSRLPQT